MSRPFSVGVIGAGAIFDHHREALSLRPSFHVTAVADIDAERAATRAAALGCAAFSDTRALLETHPDLVLVLLPHGLHHAVTLEALRAGCHVVVEKPMAVNAAQCREMMGEATRLRRLLAVADSASAVPGAIRTGGLFRAGELGRFLAGSIINVRRYFDESRPAWFLDPSQSGGGMFANLGVHRLALARACLPGLQPVRVSAAVGPLAGLPVEACTAAFVRYSDGGAMHYEELGYFPRPTWLSAGIHFAFEKGLVSWDDAAWRIQGTQGGREEPLPPRPVQYAPLYEEVEAALRGEIALPTFEGNARDVAVAEAAYASALRGVEISLEDAEWRIPS